MAADLLREEVNVMYTVIVPSSPGTRIRVIQCVLVIEMGVRHSVLNDFVTGD